MRSLIYLLFIVSPLIGGELSGKITDLSGIPVNDVKICITSWFCSKSDQDGLYKLDNSWNTDYRHSKVVRFSKQGYKAAIMEISNDNMDIILEKATTGYNEWFLPNCSLDTGSENKLIGNNRFNVTVSNKISEKKSSGGDYEIIYIPSQAGNKSENKNDYLIFMEGSSVSNGLPSWRWL